ncbi:MAG: diguanylate cyclase response regulator [Sulfurospirillum sp.]|nr:MAG: diguanylate cyclase response regulator [Sulfurospirillum sp.]
MQAEEPRIQDISILYVEDEVAIREGYARALNRISNHVMLASNGKEGLALFQEERPDIVISDIRMPVMDGIEMVQQIKEIEPECSVIFTTAYNDSEYLLHALDLQVDAYLQKPVEKNLLKYKIEKLAASILKEKIHLLQQKEIESQRVILQNVLDHEKNLLVVTDFEKVHFANKAFLDLFSVESAEAFNRMCISFLNIFSPVSPYLHRGLLAEGETFYDLVERSEETKRIVTIVANNAQPRAYQINISRIIHEARASYLCTMTDITGMNSERLSTEKKAYYDSLTGIFNRHKFNELFEIELSRVKRYSNHASVVVLDIDHFKHFNDTFGHLVGDKVLQKLAQTISRRIRTTDIFARWGGEEFVLLLPETAIHDAVKLCEMLRESIAAIRCIEADSITASFGVTELLADDTVKSAFKRADDALYAAKKAGRNRVMTVS